MFLNKNTISYKINIFSKKNNSYVSFKNINGEKLILLKPDTFMNNSGLSALNLKSFYNIHNENIYVFHDEIDLDPSKIKIKKGGGHNGHNGNTTSNKMNHFKIIKIKSKHRTK